MKHLTIILPTLALCFTLNGQVPAAAQAGLGIIAPTNGTVLDTSLTAVLRWQYPALGAGYTPGSKALLQVSAREDLSAPLLSIELAGECDHLSARRRAADRLLLAGHAVR